MFRDCEVDLDWFDDSPLFHPAFHTFLSSSLSQCSTIQLRWLCVTQFSKFYFHFVRLAYSVAQCCNITYLFTFNLLQTNWKYSRLMHSPILNRIRLRCGAHTYATQRIPLQMQIKWNDLIYLRLFFRLLNRLLFSPVFAARLCAGGEYAHDTDKLNGAILIEWHFQSCCCWWMHSIQYSPEWIWMVVFFLSPFDGGNMHCVRIFTVYQEAFLFLTAHIYSVHRKVPVGVCKHIHFGNMIIKLRQKMAPVVCPIVVILNISFEFFFFKASLAHLTFLAKRNRTTS